MLGIENSLQQKNATNAATITMSTIKTILRIYTPLRNG